MTALALFAATLAMPSTPAAAAGCSDSELVPVLRLVEVNQGLPVYREPLVYGKDTIVKLSLSAPECATSDQTLTLAPGSEISVTPVVGGVPSLTETVPTVMAGGQVVSATQAPSPDSAGDPVFTVPGAALAPAPATGPAFTATFAPTVAYTRNNNGVTTTATVAFPSFTRQFDVQQNALRVLVVPMGDFSSSTPQFTTPTTNGGGANAQSQVQAAFQSALSRMLPLAAGVDSLSAPPPTDGPAPGLRYAINGGLLDLGMGPNGLKLMDLTSTQTQKFCGKYTSFSALQTGLGDILKTYNATNPAFPANRVLGVIDETVSLGGSSGCFEGQAELGGTTAWSRVFWQPGSPDWTAPLAAMELGHTLGLTRPDPDTTTDCVTFTGNSGFHSKNTAADGCSPGRAYSTATALRLPYARSFSKLSDSYWTAPNVLMEPLDYEFGQCVLGGSSQLCEGYPVMSGFTPAEQRPRFTISGSITATGPTTSTAQIGDSYVSSADFTYDTEELPAAGHRWVLAYLDSTGGVTTEGLLVAEEESGHGSHDGVPDARTFSSARPLPEGTQRVQLRDTAAMPPTVLYERVVDPNQAPVITDTAQWADDAPVEAGPPARLTTTDEADETAPALSGTGLAAWQNGRGLVLVKVGAPGTTVATVDGSAFATSPDFSSDGREIVYERGGNIYKATVSWDGSPEGAVTVSGRETVYETAASAFPARHPSFAPAGDRVVIEYGGDLYVIYVRPTPLGNPLGCSLPGRVLLESCSQLTASGADGSPSWESSSGSEFIAFTRERGISRLAVDALTGSASAPEVLVQAPEQGALADPSYGAGVVAYSYAGNVFLHHVGGATQQLTHLASDIRPSIVGSRAGASLVFQRTFTEQVGSTTQQEIMTLSVVANTASASNTYSIVAYDPDGDPRDLRAEFIRSCPARPGETTGRNEVLGAAVEPDDINGTYARFTIAANPLAIPSLGCTGGTVRTRVSDGAATSSFTDTGTITPGDATPVVAISAPTAHAEVLPGRTVVLLGTGYGPDSTVLPESGYSWRVHGDGYDRTVTGSARVELSLAPGEYTAVLTVTDGANSSSASTPFSVRAGAAPVPTITSPAADTTFVTGTAVDIAGSATDAEDGVLPAGALDWAVTAPDGSVHTAHNTAALQVTPTTPGAWSVQLAATDSHGQSATTRRAFTVVSPTVDVDINFAPTTINAPPLPSDPDWVTVKVRRSGLDLSKVVGSTVRVTRIGPYTADNDTAFPRLRGGCRASTGTCYEENAWRVSGTLPDLTGTVQFDRKTLATYLALKGLQNQYVQIVVAGDADEFVFSGYDPSSPTVKG